MSARRREAAHSVGAGRRLSCSSSFLLPAAGGMLRRSALSLSPTLLHWFAFSPSFLNHLSPSLTPACHFHFFSPAGSPSLSPSLPPSHSLVISLTLQALSTVKADWYQQRHTHTHTQSPPHTHYNWLVQTMSYSFSLPLSLLPLSPTDNEITSDAVILLMSFTRTLRHKKEWFNFSWPALPGPHH